MQGFLRIFGNRLFFEYFWIFWEFGFLSVSLNFLDFWISWHVVEDYFLNIGGETQMGPALAAAHDLFNMASPDMSRVLAGQLQSRKPENPKIRPDVRPGIRPGVRLGVWPDGRRRRACRQRRRKKITWSRRPRLACKRLKKIIFLAHASMAVQI